MWTFLSELKSIYPMFNVVRVCVIFLYIIVGTTSYLDGFVI